MLTTCIRVRRGPISGAAHSDTSEQQVNFVIVRSRRRLWRVYVGLRGHSANTFDLRKRVLVLYLQFNSDWYTRSYQRYCSIKMDSRAGPSRSKNRSKTSTPSSRKKRWLSDDSEGSEGFSDEEVCSQRAQEE